MNWPVYNAFRITYKSDFQTISNSEHRNTNNENNQLYIPYPVDNNNDI